MPDFIYGFCRDRNFSSWSRSMEEINMWSGEGTTVSNASSESQTSTAELQSVVSALEYEVFLSFRGPDVRKSFADFLYSYLVRSKIRTFRDEEELQKGETIAPSLIQAIEESKIYIPILSESYASSKWCLQELAKMVECCRKGKGHIILPVFYFMDPRDVRHQAGPYEDAFEKHSKKHDPGTVQEWRTALQEVGQMKGWHVTEIHGQGAVIDGIFSKVELHLRSNYTLVTRELVGIDSHVQEVMKLLNLDSRDEKIVGIQGIGGMGKTTVAKAVYDNICTSFSRCCFLENVRELLSKNDGIVALQNKLISSILRVDFQVKEASEGVKTIRERVCKYKVLVVLDDVDDAFEFDQILGKLDHFSSESRFIITTRDKRVLELLQECKLYEPEEMSYDHSLQLFSQHAFRVHHPPEDYATLCHEFVKVAGRLPLALKVMGSLLFRRDKQFWEEKLRELKNLPATSNKVQQRLKISYNELTHNEKQIFLDIACFFVGEDKESPIHMWSDCKFYPESGLRTLVLRSLIKINERNQFWMHDLLRDLGRAIVIEEDVENPSKRSRIWSSEDAINMLKYAQGTDRVEMLRVDMRDDSNLILTAKTFEKMAGLRYLDMAYVAHSLTGDFSGILPDIRWLRLHRCNALRTDFNLKKVVILVLQHCYVTSYWGGWSEVQVAHNLKVIDLTGCFILERVPELAQCESLESIDLTDCSGMRGELDIGGFRNLKVVRFPGTEITDLTGDMGKLQKLQEIKTSTSVWKAQEIVLPTDVKRLTISSPKVSNLLELKELEELRFMECDAAPVIPGGIWQLTKLKTLELYKCKRNGSLLADEEGTLPSSLNTLNIHGRFFRYRLPNLANLNGLTELRLTNVWITEIRGLGELRMLEVLVILSSALYNLCGLENLVNLKELTLQNCRRLESLPSLSTLVKLHSIEITKCRVLSKIQGLGGLRRSLLNLTVNECDMLIEIEGAEYLEALESLTWESNPFLALLSDTPGSGPHKQLPDLSLLRELKELRIIGWVEFTEVKGLERLTSLKSLVMLSCLSLRRFPDLSGLKDLERLIVGSCNQLVDVTGIRGLDSLLKLELSCSLIEELPDTSGMKNLRQLDVSQCSRLTKVVGLDKLEELRGLNMCGCESIKKLPDMSRLKNLMYLNLKGCIHLKDVKGLEKLKNLGYMEMEKRLKVKHYLKSATSYAAGISLKWGPGWSETMHLKADELQGSLSAVFTALIKSIIISALWMFGRLFLFKQLGLTNLLDK
ncbi:Disease resistance protein L6, partial [Linum grandiflorum]